MCVALLCYTLHCARCTYASHYTVLHTLTKHTCCCFDQSFNTCASHKQRDVDRADEDLQRKQAKERRAKEKADSEAIRLRKRTKKKKHEVRLIM